MNATCENNKRQSPEEILKQWWGYGEFRPMQREIIESVMAGRDTLALMPTGGGKSLTYQIPALASEGVTIVVTPLIALMKDQVDGLRRRGIAAVAVHSGMDRNQIEAALDNSTYGDVKLLYIAPERLATAAFRARLRRMRVSIIAVDEAHCISQWGYDFRPSYLRIAELREYAPEATILALTASATERVSHDIMYHLGFRGKNILRSSFARPNLSYVVREVEDKYDHLLRVVRNVGGSGIIYMRTREGCERLAAQLKDDGVSVNFYHAGLPTTERALRQDDWQEDRVQVMVATNAFGMGIDKADVRFVIHYSMCDSLEAYYQEAGRAGRDGRRSYAVMLYAREDADKLLSLFREEFPPIEEIKRVYERVCNYLQVAIGDGCDSSYAFNIYDFCHKAGLSLTKVTSALKILELNELMTLIDEQDHPARLMFTCSRDALYRLNVGGNDMDTLLVAILRTYNGIFSQFRYIDELLLASSTGLSPERVHELLSILWRTRIARYIPASRSPMIYFDSERLPTADLFITPDSYRRRYDVALERAQNMIRYVTNGDVCRSQIIEEYFGDKAAKPCGVCDICLSRRHVSDDGSAIDNSIIKALSQSELSVKDLINAIHSPVKRVAERIDKMLSEGKISMSESGKLKINT